MRLPTLHSIVACITFVLFSEANSAAPTDTVSSSTIASQVIAGDNSVVRNVDGAFIAALQGGNTANDFVRLSSRTPMVWARYNPGQGIGTILIVTTRRMADGTTSLSLTPFPPANGSVFASGGVGRTVRYYGGTNPFGAFDAGDANFRNISFSAFLAATGLVMRSVTATVGFVYHPALIPTSNVTATGSELAFNNNTTIDYKAEGRWLMALAGESGDRRGFVPAYRVQGCVPADDARSQCVVKGFASFVPWNDGNLPTGAMALASRTAQGEANIAGLSTIFAGIESIVRERALWVDSAWEAVSGRAQVTAVAPTQTQSVTNNSLSARTDVLQLNSAGTRDLNTSIVDTGMWVASGTSAVWDASDAATAEFITKPITSVGGGLGQVALTAQWQSGRDTQLAADVKNRIGTVVARQPTVFGTTVQVGP
jgi:hypothetical protein